MAEIRERNEWEFRRILHAAKYRQLNFSIKTSSETWNEENRLKVSVVSVEPVLDNLQKHVERLKAEIETLKIWVCTKSRFWKEKYLHMLRYNKRRIFMTFEWFDWFLSEKVDAWFFKKILPKTPNHSVWKSLKKVSFYNTHLNFRAIVPSKSQMFFEKKIAKWDIFCHFQTPWTRKFSIW